MTTRHTRAARWGRERSSSARSRRCPAIPAPLLALAEAQPLDPTFGPFVQPGVGAADPGRGRERRPRLLHRAGPAAARRAADPGHQQRDHASTARARRWLFPTAIPTAWSAERASASACWRTRPPAAAWSSSATARPIDTRPPTPTSSSPRAAWCRLCRSQGWPFTPWHDFGELTVWLDATVAAWRSNPASLPRPVARPFICGPEVWGPGRTETPAATGRPGRDRARRLP